MVAQTGYTTGHAAAYAGQIDNHESSEVKSAVADGAIPFGYGVMRKPAVANGVGVPTGAGMKFLGVAVRDLSIQADSSGVVQYADETNVSRMEKGQIWVPIDDTVAIGDPVFVRHTAPGTPGEFRMDADTAKAEAVPNAIFMDAGVSGDIVRIHIPAAIEA